MGRGLNTPAAYVGRLIRIYLRNNQAIKTQTGAEMGSVKTSSHSARSGSRAKSLPMVKELVFSNSLVQGIDGAAVWCSLIIRAMVALASAARSGHPERDALPATSPVANEQHEEWVHS